MFASWLIACLLVCFPTLDMLVQDMLGWRTYTQTIVSLWLVVFLLAICCARISPSVRTIIVLGVFVRYANNILFPTHIVLEWMRMAPNVPRRTSALLMRRCFQSYFRLHHNFDTLSRVPHIIVVNYPNDKWEHLALFMIQHPFAFVIKQTRANERAQIARRVPCIFVPREGGKSFNAVQSQIRAHLAAKRHVVAYINSESRLHPHHFDNPRTGILRIAQDLRVPVTPMVVDQFVTQWDGAIVEQPFYIRLGKPMQITNVAQDVLVLRRFFTDHIRRFQGKKNLNICA